MYIPSAFAETDREKLFDLIERYSFGLLISQVDDEAFATHLPTLLDRAAGSEGTVVRRRARPHPRWRHADGQTVLVVCSGPHAYVTPTWYEARNVVPTWNYAAVHAYGTFRAVHDEQSLMRIVEQYVSRYEASLAQPWKLDATSDFNKK